MNNQTYNGYKNYATWNVALWINNDESLYELAKLCVDYKDFVNNITDLESGGTPDNISWFHADLDVDALNEIIKEL